jgi:hypothetical protein
MATTTAKGAPYPEGSDPPNGPAQIQALAEWIDGLLTASDQQILMSDDSTASDVVWRFPRARTASTLAALTGAADGDLARVTAGAEEGWYGHTGEGWETLVPDLSAYPKGLIGQATANTNTLNITDPADIVTLVFTAEADRLYEIRAHCKVQYDTAGRCVGYGNILAQGVDIGTFGAGGAQIEGGGDFVIDVWDGSISPREFTPGSVTLKLQVQAGASTSVDVLASASDLAWIAVYDVGPAD